jgi:hypothetical protein
LYGGSKYCCSTNGQCGGLWVVDRYVDDCSDCWPAGTPPCS